MTELENLRIEVKGLRLELESIISHNREMMKFCDGKEKEKAFLQIEIENLRAENQKMRALLIKNILKNNDV